MSVRSCRKNVKFRPPQGEFELPPPSKLFEKKESNFAATRGCDLWTIRVQNQSSATELSRQSKMKGKNIDNDDTIRKVPLLVYIY